METLKKFNLVYVATPYAKYPGGINMAWREACRVTGKLIAEGVHAYSPIVHSHAVECNSDLSFDHAQWLAYDERMMAKSDAMVMVAMDGYWNSDGIQHELMWFLKRNKPVYTLFIDDWRLV